MWASSIWWTWQAARTSRGRAEGASRKENIRCGLRPADLRGGHAQLPLLRVLLPLQLTDVSSLQNMHLGPSADS